MGKGFLLLVAALVPTIVHADQYLCIADSSVGFSFNKGTKSWERANFRVGENKYVLSGPKSEGAAYLLTRMGSQFAEAQCEKGFNDPGYLFCSGFGGDFKFNRRNGRYLKTYTVGYFNVVPGVNEVTDENSDTPYLEIGKCSSF